MAVLIIGGTDYTGIPVAEVLAHLAGVRAEWREIHRAEREQRERWLRGER